MDGDECAYFIPYPIVTENKTFIETLVPMSTLMVTIGGSLRDTLVVTFTFSQGLTHTEWTRKKKQRHFARLDCLKELSLSLSLNGFI